MKNKVAKGVLLFCSISFIMACNTKKAEPVAIDKELIKKEIQAKEDEFAATYNAGEMKNIGYYAEDATTFYQNKAPLVGREAIVEFLRTDLASNTNKISFTTNEVFVSSDGILVLKLALIKLLTLPILPLILEII